uniref:Glycine cleavage system H protein n=1 Tax=Candidatus Endecteinascidia fromenterensis TaxID=266021 RepID=G8D481_9GAMM|nr:glycine cleavage system H protein [Candidatus Endoecteinascidia frumentensis]
MKNHENYKYNSYHQWILLQSKIITIGITDYAQSLLGNFVYIEFLEIGKKVYINEKLCTVESVKTASDLYSSVNGEILLTNKKLLDKPNLLNLDPYYTGWLYQIKLFDVKEIIKMMSYKNYKSLVSYKK